MGYLRQYGLSLVLVCATLLAACTKEGKTYTKTELDQAIDSIVQIKEEQIRVQAQKDLELRSRIELKPLVDSILGKKDSIPPIPLIDSVGMSTQFFTDTDGPEPPTPPYEMSKQIKKDSVTPSKKKQTE